MILSTHGVLASSISQGVIPLLDLYGSAAAAYSVRKLRTAYTGSAIRVRRSSDNTESDIGFTALGNLDTTSLTSFCGAGNGFVTTWYDQSGNGNNATQSTAANQPQIVSSGSVILDNGKPSVQFDGSNDFLNISAVFTSNIQLSSFTVHSTTNVSTQQYIYSNPNNISYGGGYVHRYQGDTKLRHYAQTSSIQANSGVLSSNTQYLSTAISYGTTTETSEIYINGSFGGSGTGTPSSRDAKSNTNIGRSEAFGGYMNGKIQELIAYSTNESSNRTGIETNINNFYSIY